MAKEINYVKILKNSREHKELILDLLAVYKKGYKRDDTYIKEAISVIELWLGGKKIVREVFKDLMGNCKRSPVYMHLTSGGLTDCIAMMSLICCVAYAPTVPDTQKHVALKSHSETILIYMGTYAT